VGGASVPMHLITRPGHKILLATYPKEKQNVTRRCLMMATFVSSGSGLNFDVAKTGRGVGSEKYDHGPHS